MDESTLGDDSTVNCKECGEQLLKDVNGDWPEECDFCVTPTGLMVIKQCPECSKDRIRSKTTGKYAVKCRYCKHIFTDAGSMTKSMTSSMLASMQSPSTTPLLAVGSETKKASESEIVASAQLHIDEPKVIHKESDATKELEADGQQAYTKTLDDEESAKAANAAENVDSDKEPKPPDGNTTLKGPQSDQTSQPGEEHHLLESEDDQTSTIGSTHTPKKISQADPYPTHQTVGGQSGPNQLPTDGRESSPIQPSTDNRQSGSNQRPIDGGGQSDPDQPPIDDRESGLTQPPSVGEERDPIQPSTDGGQSGPNQPPTDDGQIDPNQSTPDGGQSGPNQPPTEDRQSEPSQPPSDGGLNQLLTGGEETDPIHTSTAGEQIGPNQQPTDDGQTDPNQPSTNGRHSDPYQSPTNYKQVKHQGFLQNLTWHFQCVHCHFQSFYHGNVVEHTKHHHPEYDLQTAEPPDDNPAQQTDTETSQTVIFDDAEVYMPRDQISTVTVPESSQDSGTLSPRSQSPQRATSSRKRSAAHSRPNRSASNTPQAKKPAALSTMVTDKNQSSTNPVPVLPSVNTHERRNPLTSTETGTTMIERKHSPPGTSSTENRSQQAWNDDRYNNSEDGSDVDLGDFARLDDRLLTEKALKECSVLIEPTNIPPTQLPRTTKCLYSKDWKEILISQVRSRPPLYTLKLSEALRDPYWDEVTEALIKAGYGKLSDASGSQKTVKSVVKMKWRTIRDNCVKALRRRLAGSEDQQPKLPDGMDWYIPLIIDNVKKKLNTE